MTTAAIYCRRSTDQQGASLDDQEAACRAYAEQQGWEVAAVYRESVSAFKPGRPRPEFERMMADAKAGRFGVLVVWRMNRLSRQEGSRSALAVRWHLRDEAGVEVHSVKEPRTGVDLGDDVSDLVASHQGSAESRGKSADVSRGKRRGTQRGVYQGAWPPYGFRFLDKRAGPYGDRLIKFFEPDPETAPVVAEMFTRYLAGESPGEIAVDLNARGVRPPRSSGYSPSRQGARRAGSIFHQTTVRNILRSPLSGGFATFKDRRVKACPCGTLDQPHGWAECDHDWVRSLNLPALVDDRTWEAAQARLALRSRQIFGGDGQGGASETFLLMELLFCRRCGERLACRKARKAGATDRYVCRGRRNGRGCDLPTIDRAMLDRAVRDHLVADRIVDSVETLRIERDRLMSIRSSEASLIAQERSYALQRAADARGKAARARRDYENGELAAKLFSELSDDYDREIAEAQTAADRLATRLAEVEDSMPVEQMDAMLDRLVLARRIIAGVLDAEITPALNAKLHELFDSLVIDQRGARVTATPAFRDDGPMARVLDFGDERSEGVEIGESWTEGVVLRKIALVDGSDEAVRTW